MKNKFNWGRIALAFACIVAEIMFVAMAIKTGSLALWLVTGVFLLPTIIAAFLLAAFLMVAIPEDIIPAIRQWRNRNADRA